MSEKLTNARRVASGAHLFARYVRTCCENRNGGVSMNDQDLLDGYVRSNDLSDEERLRQLICLMFPDPIKECFSSDGNSKGNPADLVWSIDLVQKHWRYTHTGPKSGVTSSRPENGCRTIRAKVLRKHPSVDKVYEVEVEGEKVLVIDLFDLKPTPEEFVYFHQRVICEVEEPADYHYSIGLDGGENQFGRAESPDSEEGGKAYETSPVGLGGRYKLVTDIRSDGDSVEVGIPATVSPPTTGDHCECGHECKGGHSCSKAPHYVQFRDASNEVVSPGCVVSGRVLANNVVCGTDPLPVEDVLFGNRFDGNPS